MNRRIIFNTPVVFHLFYAIAWLGLRLAGWKLKGRPPRARKYVIIAYPHTSNWDFPLGLSACIIYRIKVYWLGKDSLFKGPAGPIMKWLGGIPIDRSKAQDFIKQVIETFDQSEQMVIAVAPEGTRSAVKKWKTGFYHIASGANVPIVPGYLDYAKKEVGFLESFYPGGDIDKDIPAIKAIYGTIQGKNADQSG
ncbi:MAG: lysophospholipid acyltransferase family protein [Gammaproteobacteria bacterium]|nr:lysophospholipid acyltransferase family protein [Gammaproteobacteria bacterium]